MGWLRERAERDAAPGPLVPRDEPWVPPVLAEVSWPVLRLLTYAVLDEKEGDGEVTLVLTPWPRADDLGRVRHRRSRAVDVAVPGEEWQAMLAERRLPEVLRDRAPRIGDAFAMLLARRDERHLLDPVGPVYDITADARDAARAAFYGAVAVPIDETVDLPALTTADGSARDLAAEALPEPAQWAAYAAREERR